MQAKEFIFEDMARQKLKLGIETLSDVAQVTLGPKGRNIGLATAFGAPSITSDGYSIVKEIELKDQYVNMGIEIGKQMASKMKELCGDGTTTSLILLNSLTQNGVKLITSGASPILIKRGMEKALSTIIHHIDQMAVTLDSSHDIQKMAEAASSGSVSIGKMLAEAFRIVGKQGSITIKEGKYSEDELEIVDGMEIERGYLSPHFCNNKERMECEFSKAKVLITDKKIHSVHELVPLLQQVATSGSSLVIIADDIDQDALATLVINNVRGILKVAAIKAPGFGDNKKAMLEDIATLVEATVITEDKGMNLKEASLDFLGNADKIIIGKDRTLITQEKGASSSIKERIAMLENQINQTTSSYDRDKLIERKNKLSGGVAVISTGAPSEPEMKKRKQLYQDALNSTKAALEEGIVIGAGMTLASCSRFIKNPLHGDEKLGFDLVLKAIKAPALQIIKNVGLDPVSTLEEAFIKGHNHGLNMLTEEIEDLKKSGVFDAAKVVKTAVSLACSSAGIVLLSEALIGDAEET